MFSTKTRIKNKIWSYIRDYFYFQRIADSSIIQNINYNDRPDKKNAVICYLTESYFTDFESLRIDRTQPFEILKIVNVLCEMNYVIDIIQWDDLDALKLIGNKKYDLIFGFGETFYQLTKLNPDAFSVLYMTEGHPEFSLREEKKRVDYFYERHGKRVKVVRSGCYYKEHHLQKTYSHLIAFGEIKYFISQYSNPSVIFPSGIINFNFRFNCKNHTETRCHYLWLGSRGAIHKGLDILLDVFSEQTNIVLHICGLQKSDRKQLTIKNRENIILYGKIDIGSDIFLEVVDKCSFIILPSCSEGFSTSITTGMLHGLIPVVVRDTGFNRLFDNAIFLEDIKIGYLKEKLDELSKSDPDSLACLSAKVYEFARENFTIQVFEKKFRSIMADVLKISQ